MKKTSVTFKSAIVIAAVTILISCKKEIEHPQNALGASHNARQAALVTELSATAKTKTTGNGYTGNSTLGDSTVATK